MLAIEKTVLPSPEQWEIVIEGMRNPMNSWDKSDSIFTYGGDCRDGCHECSKHCPRGDDFSDEDKVYCIGDADHNLMTKLAKGGAVHAKYRRMIPVWVTINAPLYWWKEFDTYKVGTVCNSCSTMHKIHSKEFTLDDFSHEHLDDDSMTVFEHIIANLNDARDIFVNGRKEKHYEIAKGQKDYWWQMIQLLPSSYNQKRTVMLNYEVLVNIYKWRCNHKLDEWHTFCNWIEGLPYADLIVGGAGE